MANPILAHPNSFDLATLSGGSWESTLPLTNLQTRVLGEVAQTVDNAAASTRFLATYPTARPSTIHGLIAHNLETTDTFRLRGATDAAITSVLYDSGVTDVWPVIYPYGSLPIEDPRFFTGRPDAEEREGYNAALVVTLPSIIYCKYWYWEIFTSASYLRAGRAFMSNGWQSERDADLGASVGYKPRSEVELALGGTAYFNTLPPLRTAKISLSAMSKDEAYTRAWELMRRAESSGEVLFSLDPDDDSNMLRTTFLAHLLPGTSPIVQPHPKTVGLYQASFELEELL